MPGPAEGNLTCTNCRARCRFCTLQCASRSSAPYSSTSPLWTRACNHLSRRRKTMLWTICLVLLVLWALGMATSYTAGGLIHVLLVIGLIVLVFRLIQGRRVLG